jgi:hypothetical protein
MKHVDIEALVSIAVPVIPKMTRREKLAHWAGLVRSHHNYLHLYHNLEYLHPSQLAEIFPRHIQQMTAFSLALADKTLNSQGLDPNSNLIGVMGFFELSQRQLHEFSCDCGGEITNHQMADRIERI